MPEYSIERDVPGAGTMSATGLKAMSQPSRSILNRTSSRIRRDHGDVTRARIFFIPRAPRAGMIREHARPGGFPTNVTLVTGD